MKEILDSRQKKINYCGGGMVVLFTNEEEVKQTDRVQTGVDTFEDKEVTRYQYDKTTILGVKDTDEESVITALKENTINHITAYDSSKAVNNFTINGVSIWLDRNTRAALMRRFEAEKASGAADTTLWYGEGAFKMPVDTAIKVLNAIEIYACKCFDVTAAHKAAVAELTGIEELLAYDYKKGYPEQLNFKA